MWQKAKNWLTAGVFITVVGGLLFAVVFGDRLSLPRWSSGAARASTTVDSTSPLAAQKSDKTDKTDKSGKTDKTDKGGKTDKTDKTDKLHVLFMGNSLTFYNDMPKIVQAFARESKQPRALEVHEFTSPAFTFEHHWKWDRLREAIKNEQFDVIIMQEKSTGPNEDTDKFEKFGTMLVEEIRKNQKSAQILLFLNWSRKGFQAQDKINAATYGLADKLKIGVVPIGKAWMTTEEKAPKIPIYTKDGLHPTPQGSYLEACVIYAKLYGKSPVGLPSRVLDGDGKQLVEVSAEEARVLQQIAWDTVMPKSKDKK